MNLQTLFPTPFVQIENPYLAARVRPLINTILDDPQYHSSIMNYTSTFDPMNKIEDQIELAQPLVSMKEYLFDLGVAFLNQAGYQTDLCTWAANYILIESIKDKVTRSIYTQVTL